MNILKLTDNEIDQVETLMCVVESRYDSESCPEFLTDAQHLAHKMPERICKFLADFKYKEPGQGICVISGLPVDQVAIGKTPTCVSDGSGVGCTKRENFIACLMSSLLGDVFGWATQQSGKLVHDIAPVKAHEFKQIGSGSRELITLHCEDAFHEYRADYLGLMCLRNPDAVSTTFSTFDPADLSGKQALLYHPKFTIKPDDSHLKANNDGAGENSRLVELSFLRIQRELEEGIFIPLLFGDESRPYLRLDPYFMDEPEEECYREAYHALCDSLKRNTVDIALQQGDILFIDNYRAVHGRKGFSARFDGNDRWLKRLNITRDLRKSRALRASVEARVIY